MGFKTFVSGTTLPAADLNDYLMKQANITCTSSTRPGAPVTGMKIYETDTDLWWYYNGTTWVGIGKGIIAKATNNTANLGHSATTFGTSSDVAGVTVALNSTARYYRISVIIPSVATTYASGNGVGQFGISDGGTQLAGTWSAFGVGSTLGHDGPAVSYVGNGFSVGSHSIGLRFWCGASVTNCVINTTAGDATTLTVEDLGTF